MIRVRGGKSGKDRSAILLRDTLDIVRKCKEKQRSPENCSSPSREKKQGFGLCGGAKSLRKSPQQSQNKQRDSHPFPKAHLRNLFFRRASLKVGSGPFEPQEGQDERTPCVRGYERLKTAFKVRSIRSHQVDGRMSKKVRVYPAESETMRAVDISFKLNKKRICDILESYGISPYVFESCPYKIMSASQNKVGEVTRYPSSEVSE